MCQFIFQESKSSLGEGHNRIESRTRPNVCGPCGVLASRRGLFLAGCLADFRMDQGVNLGIMPTPGIRGLRNLLPAGVLRWGELRCFEGSDAKILAPLVYKKPQGAGLQIACWRMLGYPLMTP